MTPRWSLGIVDRWRRPTRRSRGPSADDRSFADRLADLERAGFGVPFDADLPEAGTLQRGAIWGVALVRNEHDIVEAVLRHLVDQGVDHLVVADHGSTDGTRTLLRGLATELPLTVVDDPIPGYHQAEKTSILARRAALHGAGWVVPFDADELWFARGCSLASALARTEAAMVEARLWNYVPTMDDDEGPDPLDRLRHRQAVPATGIHKVAFRPNPDVIVGRGNHEVAGVAGALIDGLEIAHFPYRSFEQYRTKVRQGRDALDREGAGEAVIPRWSAAAAHTDAALERIWDLWVRGKGGLPGGTALERQGPLIDDPVTAHIARGHWPAPAGERPPI